MVPACERYGAPLGEAFQLRDDLLDVVGDSVRFPNGPTGPDIPALDTVAGMDLLAGAVGGEVLILPAGATAGTALAVADRLTSQGISTAVVDPRWIKPVNPAVGELAAACRAVVTIEDGAVAGGFGSAVGFELQRAGLTVPVLAYGIPQSFPPHGSRAQILEACHLTPQDIARDVVERFTRLDDASDADAVTALVGRASYRG